MTIEIRKSRIDSGPIWSRVVVALFVAILVLFVSAGNAQQLTGTLSGTAADQTGAVIPRAAVVLKNNNSGDVRLTRTDSVGFFSITAVQPASYTLTISADGFKTWQLQEIVMNQGDTRTVANIKLSVGGKTDAIEVISGSDAVVPLDTSETSTTLNTQMIQDIALGGRDAGELLKLMPGMALNRGLTQGSSFDTKVVGTNSGPVGAYSSNGTQPNGSMAFMLDGANLVDPGNMGTQIANINQDMTAEVKVLTSGYGAEYAKGPVIFQAFSKSGGAHFHGEGYLYARNSVMNSVDAYTKSQHGNNKAEQYYYAGGNVGGPVILPFTSFNKDRNKLFFWGGYESMIQHPAGSIVNYNVPTSAQMAGDFSNTGVDPKVLSTWNDAYANPSKNLPVGVTSSSVAQSSYDPNILGILKLYPKANITPSSSNGWNNFAYASSVPQNRWEATGKLDYAISDNTKLTGSYTRQIENDQHPISIWWAAPWTLPYPSPVLGATNSQEVMANLTHAFNATTTNEFVFTMARYLNPNTLTNPAAVDRTKLGFGVKGLFGHTTRQIPNFSGPWGGSMPNIGEFSFDQPFSGLKKTPAFYDNFTKLLGTHSLKTGFYWDGSTNVQSNGGNDNGVYNYATWGGLSTGNLIADLLVGRPQNYTQQSSVPAQTAIFHQWSLYAQDSYKANRQLTLNFGLRFDHIGQWYSPGQGLQVWDPASYNNGHGANDHGAANTGILWHGKDSSVPLSGWTSPVFYVEPRLGMAYDVFGTGKTVIRGGLAVFRYQVSTQVCAACNGPLGSFQFSTPSAFRGYAGIADFTPPSTTQQNGGTISVMQRGDNRTPQTMNWNFTVSQAMPWRSVFEVSYVANKSTNEYINGANGKIADLNNVRPGTLFRPDPVTGTNVSPSAPSCGTDPVSAKTNYSLYCVNNQAAYSQTFTADHFRPYANYQDIYLLTHGSYANYNSLQVSWQKQSGPINFLTNYTFGKVLGIWDGQSDNGSGNGTTVDPFNMKNNYGPLAYDHTQILNLAYVWNLPKPLHGNPILAEAVNGWQFSGVTGYQSGAPLQPNLNGGLNAQYPGSLTVPTQNNPNLPDNSVRLPNGLRAIAVTPSTWLGSGAYNLLLPQLVCDPSKNLSSGQSFNPKCFAPPSYGQQGTLAWPYMHGPAYFNSDLALFKNFRIAENQKLQFRVSATNFLNHPLRQFGLAGQSDQQLSFIATAPSPTEKDSNGKTINVQSLSQTNTNTTTTGKPAFKSGSRSVTFAVKYYF